MRNIPFFLALVISLMFGSGLSAQESGDGQSFTVEIEQDQQLKTVELIYDKVRLGNGPVDVEFRAISMAGRFSEKIEGVAKVVIQGKERSLIFEKGVSKTKIELGSSGKEDILIPGIGSFRVKVKVIPAWLSILPPLIAIVLALVIKEVVASLLLGIFAGAFILTGLSFEGIGIAFLRVIDTYIIGSLLDRGHLAVVLFSTMIGGMVALVSRNGGMAGIVHKFSAYAKSGRSSQLITWALGIAIFFDDYANTLIVGNTMRPVTDRFKVSREKLSYLVDSTAAPVAAVAFVTTWIGAELGYIKDAVSNLNISESAYSIFLNSLQYAYYPFFTILFMFLLIWMRRDYGPMWTAEDRAHKTGVLNLPSAHAFDDGQSGQNSDYETIPGVKVNWWNAFLPVSLVVVATIVGLIYTGLEVSQEQIKVLTGYNESQSTWAQLGLLSQEGPAGWFRKLGIVIGNADAYNSLLWASFSGLLLALLLSVSRGIMKLHQAVEVMLTGFRTMLMAMLILTLAWSISKVTEDLHTADYITSLVSGNVPVWLLPSITFVLAGLIAFATGTSWGTMAILYPLSLPAAWQLAQVSGLDSASQMELMYHMASVVLAGSVLGDHCSPISDTTIMSSLASDCNHLQHVKTQMPYAMTVGGVAILCSLLASALALPFWMIFLIGGSLLWVIVRFFGRKYDWSS
jgi:Na+/H+ antiporter NhaC